MAPFRGFIGGSGRGRSTQANPERAINWHVERIESQGGRTKSDRILLSKPGLALFCALPNATSVAALEEANGRVFAVAGGTLYELFAGGSFLARGNVGVATTPQNTRLCPSQSQLLVVASGNGWIFDLNANTLSSISNAAGWIPGTAGVVNIDGYFITLAPDSQEFGFSGLNDGTQWDPLDFGDAEGEQGNVVQIIADHRQLWLLCDTHGEVYYDSGAGNDPWTRLEGAFIEQGCGAAATPANIDNSIMWLGANRAGGNIVWRTNGYSPVRVSTHALESQIAKYPTTADAIGYPYVEDGHTFYHLSFPSAHNGRGWTWVYDVATGLWHERGSWSPAPALWFDDLARVHCYGFSKHLVGDWRSGNVYVQSMDYATDNGAFIRRERIPPALANGGNYLFFHELRLLCEVGIGLDGGPLRDTAPPSLSQQAFGYNYAATFAQAFGSANVAGSAIIAVIALDATASAITSVTDSQGNTYSLVSEAPALSNKYMAVYAAFNIKAGANTVTVVTAGTQLIGIAIHEYANLAGTFEASAASGFVGPPPTIGTSLANVAAGALLFAAAVQFNGTATDGVTPGSGWTARVNGGFSAEFEYFANLQTWDRSAAGGGVLTTYTASPDANLDLWAVTIAFAAKTTSSGGDPSYPNPTPYQDPQIILQVSDDGGKTWGLEDERSLGQLGNYRTSLRWTQLGRSDNRAFKVICAEPVQVAIIAADLDLEPEGR